MVARGNDDGVDVVIVEDVTKVTSRMARPELRLGSAESRLIGVAHGRHDDVTLLRKQLAKLASAPATANDANRKSVSGSVSVRSVSWRGEGSTSHNANTCVLQECPTAVRLHP